MLSVKVLATCNDKAEIMNSQVSLAEMGERLRYSVINDFTGELICQRYLALYSQIAINKNLAQKAK